jgi:hypothetical protein
MRELNCTLFFLSLLVGCGGHPINSKMETPPKSGTISKSKSETDASTKEKLIPNDWVKIVNRSTGQQIGYRRGNSPEEHEKSSHWRIKQSGEYYKILNQFSGEYLGLSEESKQNDSGTSQMPDSKDASIYWKIEPAGNDCWRLLNRDTGKCLESRKNNTGKNIIRQSALRDNDPIQEWQIVDAKTASKPETVEKAVRYLNCENLSTGNEGVLYCNYVEMLKVIDDNSCIVLPYSFASIVNPSGGGDLVTTVHPPLLLKKWPTKDMVTGGKYRVEDQIFRVTGTEDVKRSSGEVVRVHVLELVK